MIYWAFLGVITLSTYVFWVCCTVGSVSSLILSSTCFGCIYSNANSFAASLSVTTELMQLSSLRVSPPIILSIISFYWSVSLSIIIAKVAFSSFLRRVEDENSQYLLWSSLPAYDLLKIILLSRLIFLNSWSVCFLSLTFAERSSDGLFSDLGEGWDGYGF